MEITLRTGWFDDVHNPKPVWIPVKYKKLDHEINRKNWQYASANPYRFTDRVRNVKKEAGVTRIAVLGDSFVWGYGIPYQNIWSHRLEERITRKHDNVEVMSWGLGGWSTADEFAFLEKNGAHYDIDMLIVGFVNNDPDLGNIKNKTYKWSGNPVFKLLNVFFPNAISFITSYTNFFLTNHFFHDHQYHNWMKRIYTEKNLKEYSGLLRDLSLYCSSHNIKLLFVLTPHWYDETIRKEFEKIKPLLEKAQIRYLDLFPIIKEKVGHINSRDLWANPANGHPNSLVHQIYSDSVYDYLEHQKAFFRGDNHIRQLAEEAEKDYDNSAVKVLVDTALKHDGWNSRIEAVQAIAKINSPYATDLLIASSKDNDPDIREAAVNALGELDDPRVIPYLTDAFTDKSENVRRRAAIAAGKKGDRCFVKALIGAATGDVDPYVRKHALWALAEMNDERIMKCLIHCLKDNVHDNRKTAAVALGMTKNPLAVDPLISLLNDPARDIRIEVVRALGTINTPRAVKVLNLTLLRDRDGYVRELAAKFTGKDYGPYRLKLLRIWQYVKDAVS